MRAWVVGEFGPHRDVLHLDEAVDPSCPEDGVVVRVTGMGLGFPDVLKIAGKYQVRPPLPFVPGHEAVGVVESAGPKSRRRPGQRVIVFAHLGAFAERLAAPDARAVVCPDPMSDDHAAGFVVNYQCAYFALVHRGRLEEGDWLLVHGGSGGIGSAAIQIGKALGARVIATASGPDKVAVCRRAGADHVLGDRDFATPVAEITGGRGVDVICDPVGGDAFDESTRCVAWDARLVVVGFASGRIPSVALNRVLLKNVTVTGLHWGTYFDHRPELLDPAYERLCRWYVERRIEPLIGRTFSFEELPAALTAIETRQSLGKVIVRMQGEGRREMGRTEA
jgi:NADPH2:quinone reductase